MIDTKLRVAFNEAVKSSENIDENNEINWNFVDADLCMDGWMDRLPEQYYAMFNDLADEFELNVAADRLEVLKTDYLGVA